MPERTQQKSINTTEFPDFGGRVVEDWFEGVSMTGCWWCDAAYGSGNCVPEILDDGMI
jgi:hypothetical protein